MPSGIRQILCAGTISLFLTVCATVCALADTNDTSFTPRYQPTLQVSRAAGQIKIDGDLSDAGWQGAQPAENFTEHSPGEEVKPPVETKAFVTYDDDNLYLAAVCYAEPGTVRSTLCERERIFSDDNIGFFFDTFGDGARAYIINLNPRGIPYDALWSPNYGEDGNFDLVFKSAGMVTDSGYQVEMAIPFAGLRFPNKPVQEWRFDFYRHHLREVHYSMSWAAYDKNEPCWPCKWGYVKGIENVFPGHGVELLPSFVAHQSGSVTNREYPDTSFQNGDVFGDLSIGGKYAITSDIVVEGTYNPDFSQIEADASQVDVNTTFALSYEEKRPFFQEGMDLFWTNFNAVYTRSINDPDFAAKGSATFGHTSVAALSAHDEHSPIIVPFEERSRSTAASKSYTNMVSIRHAFGHDNHIRALITDRRFDGGGSGTLASMDGRIKLTKSTRLRGQFMVTNTEEAVWNSAVNDSAGLNFLFDNDKHTAAFDGESFSGTAGLVGMTYETNTLWANVRTYQRTPTYRADNGYQPRNGDRWIIGDAGYVIRPEGTILHRIDPSLNFARIWNFNGTRKQEFIELDLSGNFRFAQAGVWTGFNATRERYAGIDFDEIWTAAAEIWGTPVAAIETGGYVTYGQQIVRGAVAMGVESTVNWWADLRPTTRLLVEPSILYTQSRKIHSRDLYFHGFIARTRIGYQFNRELSLRLVGEYDNFNRQWNIDPLITYRINPFSTFFLGSTYDYNEFRRNDDDREIVMNRLSRRQFFMKLQYLFQT